MNSKYNPETHNFKGEPYPVWGHAKLAGLLSDLHRDLAKGKKYPLSNLFREVVYKKSDRKGEYEATEEFTDLLKDQEGGIYVLWEPAESNSRAMYVGISRDLKGRLKQHLFGKTKNTSSFVYQLLGRPPEFKTSRKRSDKQAEMREHWKVSILPRDIDTYVRQIAEVFLSVQLKTHWNSFETH